MTIVALGLLFLFCIACLIAELVGALAGRNPPIWVNLATGLSATVVGISFARTGDNEFATTGVLLIVVALISFYDALKRKHQP